MTASRPTALLLLLALLGTGCVTAQARTTTWSEQPGQEEQVWYGRVSQIRETVEAYQGDPAAGALAGAVVGGVLGSAFSYGHGGGFFGAMTGAMIGAEASRGYAERWLYEVTVRYDDGSLRTYHYQGQAPFLIGDPVVLSSRGLARR